MNNVSRPQDEEVSDTIKLGEVVKIAIDKTVQS